MNPNVPLQDQAMEKLARRRAAMRMGWIIHASVFAAVNILLATLSYLSGRNWAIFPFLGWGLGLAIHGVVVLMAMPGNNLMESLVRRERERLAQRDAW
jgi:uncharacterized integral membrane protein